MKLDDFVSATNVTRYQRMLDESSNETEREIIRKLLAEELARQAPIRGHTKPDSIRFRTELEA